MVNPGIISLDLESLSVNEEVESVVIPIVRAEGSDGIVSVDYSINDGTATAGDDFTASSGTLTFAPKEISKEITVPIIDDTIPETDETFSIFIGNAVGALLGETRTAIITIEDNDATELSTIAFSQAEYNFGEDQGEASITVIRAGNDNGTVSVDYATEDDYARTGLDYTAVSGTLTFNSGEMSKTFTVPLLDDKLPELDEALTLTLSNPVGIDLEGQDTARLIIEEDDQSPFMFEQEVVVSGLAEERNGRRSGPIAFDWAPDGKMLIAKIDGIVQVFDNGELLEQPFIDLSEQVNTGGERGLLGLAVHPEFPEKPYVYLAFSYDPPELEPDLLEGGRITRLIRVAADPNSNYTTALPGSEVILLETPPVNNFHAAGAIHFGNDGSLFFSHGDGTPVDGPSSLQNAELLQSLDHPFGKLFRIEPMTGEGYSDNPFYDGDPTSIQSKVYNYGLRNPWRYALHPDTGEPVIGDVGAANWEEVNTGRGANFGWPLYEGGNGVSLRFRAVRNKPEFQELYDNTSEVTSPIYARSHSDGARAITMGDFYTGTTYPELYQGALFFNEFWDGEVNALLFDAQGNVDSVTPFSEDGRGITQISMGSDSNLYFSNLLTGEIGRWVFKDKEEVIIGTSDNDVLRGTSQNERIDGLAGNDRIRGKGGADILNGGEGIDTIAYESSPEGVTINLATETAAGGEAEGDSFSSIERIFGSNVADRLTGDDGDNLIEGNAGADTLRGGAGIDILSYNSSPEGVTINLADQTTAGGEAEGDLISGFESVIGSKFADRLTGNNGNNHLQGRDGNDVLRGKGGADILDGGKGIDTIAYESSPEGVTINLATETAAGGDAEGDSFSSIERIFGSNVADRLTGDDGDNLIEGNAGADTLRGGAGIDILSYNSSPEGVTINLANQTTAGGEAEGDLISGFESVIGSKFADRLTGNNGNNHLQGRDGNDILNGKDGDDTLIGGAGSDLFILSLDSGKENIIDFNPSDGDLLGISDNLDFNNLSFSGNNILVETQIIATLKGFDTVALTINNFTVI